MLDLKETILNYPAMTSVEKTDFLKLFSENSSIVQNAYSLFGQDADRLLLRVLSDAVRKKQALENLYFLENKNGIIKNMLFSNDAKTRKNAAELIGALCAADYCEDLIKALEKEDTEFVRPSILLALGKSNNQTAYAFLKEYTPKNTVEKHLAEEKAALLKALSSLAGEEPVVLNPDTSGFTLLLTCPTGHAALTREELEEHEIGFRDYPLIKDTLSIRSATYQSLFECRTFYEALILLGKCPPNGLESFLQNPKFNEAIRRLYGNRRLTYRIEVKGRRLKHEERIRTIEVVSRAINIPGLFNSPSNYMFELRIAVERDHCILLIKPSAALDTRFSYRLHTLPASIHPVTAASIMRHIFPYLKRGADVLDPFCGSGTMLFERAKIKGTGSLTGTDNQKYAIAGAKQNEAAARTGAQFILTDILHYKPQRQFDEIITNMPFGHRVGSHENNEKLYEGFTAALTGLLKAKGKAFLFTNDKKLLTELIEKNEGLRLLEETVFNAGNLHPSLFMLEKE